MRRENKMILRDNYTLLQKYLENLKNKGQCSKSTRDIYNAYNALILEWADEEPLKKAPSFEKTFQIFLSEKLNNDGAPYSYSYIKAACSYARRFFYWARDHDKGLKGITADWIDSIVPLRKIDEVKEIHYYTLDEVKRICALKPENLCEQRTIAALAFLILSAMRIAAFFTLPIKNIRFSNDKIFIRQSPKDGVCTKNNKAANTSTFMCSELMKVVREWDALVRSHCPANTSWYARLDKDGNFDPREIIPMTVENADELKAKARNPYKNFCEDLKVICKKAGVEYKSPHKARYGHIHLCMSKAKTMEERKAVSVNAMHGSLAITDEVYMRMGSDQVSDIYSGFDFDEKENTNNEEITSENMHKNLFPEMDPETLMKMSQFFASAAASHKDQ